MSGEVFADVIVMVSVLRLLFLAISISARMGKR